MPLTLSRLPARRLLMAAQAPRVASDRTGAFSFPLLYFTTNFCESTFSVSWPPAVRVGLYASDPRLSLFLPQAGKVQLTLKLCFLPCVSYCLSQRHTVTSLALTFSSRQWIFPCARLPCETQTSLTSLTSCCRPLPCPVVFCSASLACSVTESASSRSASLSSRSPEESNCALARAF